MSNNSRYKRRAPISTESSANNHRFQQTRQFRERKKQKTSTKNNESDDEKRMSLQNTTDAVSKPPQNIQSRSKFIEVYVSSAAAFTKDLMAGLDMIRINSTDDTTTASTATGQFSSFQQISSISFRQNSFIQSHDLSRTKLSERSQHSFNDKDDQKGETAKPGFFKKKSVDI